MKKTIYTIIAALMICMGAQAQKTYALLVGLSNYGMQGRGDLDYSAKDAKEMKMVFANQRNAQATLVTSKYATPENIKQKLRVISKLAKPQDNIIFFFSGHGAPGYVYCYQAEELTYDDISEALSEAKTKNIACFIDACYAGTAFESIINNSDKPRKPIFMLSCKPEEVSAEVPVVDNSLFSQALLKGMRGMADADGDKKITLLELFNYVYRDVTAKAPMSHSRKSQHPMLMGPTDLHHMVITKW